MTWEQVQKGLPKGMTARDLWMKYEYVRQQPAGTNLLDAQQATAMVRHMLEGMPGGGGIGS